MQGSLVCSCSNELLKYYPLRHLPHYEYVLAVNDRGDFVYQVALRAGDWYYKQGLTDVAWTYYTEALLITEGKQPEAMVTTQVTRLTVELITLHCRQRDFYAYVAVVCWSGVSRTCEVFCKPPASWKQMLGFNSNYASI